MGGTQSQLISHNDEVPNSKTKGFTPIYRA